ncbi:class I SAM-dependent methyltransferase [Alisedimentitalea sp. MJ-SS2]|uniref:class I SAM-dependent methyltransferase n=1 Tax=Aliisedimentitalea sp. MJ-SS2 TaxID=3049795 RepID=UPI00290DDBEE|nr:class I SAM-dependent methyltransferase [Alisedimentitalea sp. MJ-SS2]MDU8929501.1 class I SAM-dependent methyltransferase [Alisedimentitalea sp. MJ-SS2]
MSDERTIAVYDERVAEYSKLNEKLYEKAELEGFVAALPGGGRVLDLGCGPGFYARWMAEQGLQVEAWDASVEMVKKAANQPGVTVKQARFDELEAEAVYDGIWANFSLLHAPKAAFPGLLNRIRKAGKPGMVFHIGMKLGEGEGPDKIGRYYGYYGEDELVRYLEEAGFRIGKKRFGNGPGLSGEESPFMTVLCYG